MLSKVQKWGKSQGIIIPKTFLENTNIKVGEEVDISAHEGKIIVTAKAKARGQYNIKDLVNQMPEDYAPEELSWGGPVGREIW